MKIIYLHQYFTLPTQAGGTRSYDLSKRFINAGKEVVVVTSSAFLQGLGPFEEKWTVKQYEGIELHILKLDYDNKLGFMKRIQVFISFLREASKRLLKLKGDVVLATSTPLTIAVPAIVKYWRHKTPYIFEVRDVWPEVPIAMGIIRNKIAIRALESFERYIYRKAAHVVALSDDMKRSVLRRTKLSEDRITVIPNIAEVNRFRDYKENDHLITSMIGFKPQRVLLYAGTFGEVNGLDYLVQMAALTQHIDPELKYLLLGDGKQKEAVVKMAADQGLLDRIVFFAKPVPKSRLPQLYHECTAASSFVIPIKELWANSANKFFDCLAAGKPVVINHLGWQADVILKKNVGHVLGYERTPEHMERTAAAFCDYMNNTALLEEQGRNAQAVAREQYSLEVAADKYLKTISSAV